jgi:Domain of unknown function (DUF4326)
MTNDVHPCRPYKPNCLESVEIVVVKKGSSIKPGFQRAYIGRGTPLGNPFSHLERRGRGGSRDEAVDAYGEWLEVLLGYREATDAPVLLWLARPMVGELEARQQAARRQLNDLYLLAIQGKLELECFCVPERCHGEHVKRVLESVLQARGFAVAPSKILITMFKWRWTTGDRAPASAGSHPVRHGPRARG